MTSIPEVAQEIRTILTEEARAIGRATGFVKRESKIGGGEFSQILTFGWLNKPEATLEELAQMGAALGVEISPQGIEQRFGPEAAECLKGVLEAAVKRIVTTNPVVMPILERFTGVEIQDSTIIELPSELAKIWSGCGGDHPGNGEAALKVEVRWDLSKGGLTGPFLENGRVNENRSLVQQAPLAVGALRIADLGYWNMTKMAAQSQADIYWLSNLRTNTVIFDQNGRRWDLLNLLQSQTASIIDLQVFLGAKQQLSARLIATRVTQQVADRRRRKLREKASRLQKPVDQRLLDLADWVVIVTNVQSDLLSPREAFALIRARWQIELLFKLWKSQGLIDQWRSANPWRILCEVYAKLLAMLIQHWLFLVSCWLYPNRSLVKASSTVRNHALNLACSFHAPLSLVSAIQTLARCLAVGCRINKSKKSPRSFQLIIRSSQAA